MRHFQTDRILAIVLNNCVRPQGESHLSQVKGNTCATRTMFW